MNQEFAYELPLPMIKRIVRWSIWRTAGFWLVALIPVFAASCWFLVLGSRSVWLYLGVIATIWYWFIWARFYSQSIARLWPTERRQIRMKITEDSIHFADNDQTVILKWSAINHVWWRRDCLLLGGGVKPDWVRAIPRDAVGDDTLNSIVKSVRDKGNLCGPVQDLDHP